MERAEAGNRGARALGAKGSAALWTALAGPPFAWFAGLNASYFLVGWACRHRAPAVLHLAGLLPLAFSAACGVLAWRLWTRLGTEPPDGQGGPLPRTRFLAALALAGSALFSLILLGQWVANLAYAPCPPPPRDPFSPDARAVPAREWRAPALAWFDGAPPEARP